VPSVDVDAAEVEVDALAGPNGLDELEYENGYEPAGFDNDDDDLDAMGQLPPLPDASTYLDEDEAATQPTQPTQHASAGARAAAVSYEELCRRHVEACLEASSSYQVRDLPRSPITSPCACI
jgi:hypothetical protein